MTDPTSYAAGDRVTVPARHGVVRAVENSDTVRVLFDGETYSIPYASAFLTPERGGGSEPAPPAAPSGWRDIATYVGHFPALVARPDGDYRGPAAAFKDVTGVWRVLYSEGGSDPLYFEPTHWQPMPPLPGAAPPGAPPVSAPPAESAGEVEPCVIDYTNYRGERSLRRVTPISVAWGSNDWHPEPQWLMTAYDHDKAATRTFALKDIHNSAEGRIREMEGEVARAKDHAREVYEIGASWSRKHAVAEALLNRELARNCNRDAPDYADRLTIAAQAARDALEKIEALAAEAIRTGGREELIPPDVEDLAAEARASLASVLDGGEG